MRKLLLQVALILPLMAVAQTTKPYMPDYIESSTFNENFRGAKRSMNYRPTADGYIETVNGHNRYTRALYGGTSLWRLETSDRPVFAAYHKTDNRNIKFYVETDGKSVSLDSVEYCRTLYKGGIRIYELKNASWRGGSLTLTAIACQDKDAAIWKVESHDMPEDTRLTASVCRTVDVKINRNGDIGADPADCFAPDPARSDLKECVVGLGGNCVKYIEYFDRDVTASDQGAISAAFDRAEIYRREMTDNMLIDTPDPYFNTLGANLAAAADGIWDGKTYLHGAIGWRMPLGGWRGAYTGDFTGRHDRARSHFNAYAASQVTDVEPVIAHPSPDPEMNWARAEKKWGTQMYSNGYICRNPERNNQMHHYDMNLCYIDELLWHLNWTGDMDYARSIWPVLTAHLAWEKRNYDPDGDGLYDAYCCIWASDALYYNSGGVTHSTAYNYRANKLAAEIAEKIGEDPAPYRREAQHILEALNSTLWMKDKGVWAEFVDFMGHKRLHDHPAVWTVYHAIDSDVATPAQAYSATRYIDMHIPHIAVTGEGVPDGNYETIATTDWLPYAWSINNVAFAEVIHTALAYWQAGRPEEASRLLKSCMLDGMYMGASPGNIGQISFYDAARGESYRDFADPIGVMSRAVVQGLFGFTPDMMNRRVTVSPGFPAEWDHASLKHPDFTLAYKRDRQKSSYKLSPRLDGLEKVRFVVPAEGTEVKGLKVNGKDIDWICETGSIGRPRISFETGDVSEINVEIEWGGQRPETAGGLAPDEIADGFGRVAFGDMSWLIEMPSENIATAHVEYGIDLRESAGNKYETIDLSKHFNSSITDIFENKYLSPRSPYTTLQIPVQGIGEWCHPLETADIDDSGLRRAAGALGVFTTPGGIPFATPAEGNNVVYTSLFDNYPDSVTIPLEGSAHGIELMLAGSTNHMQCHIENARIKVTYKDGGEDVLPLVAPHNWCPIEQDYFIDGKAFRVDTPRPKRVTFKHGIVSDNLEEELNIKNVYGRRIDGGAGVLLYMPLDPQRELSSLTLSTLSNDIVAGLVAATYVRECR